MVYSTVKQQLDIYNRRGKFAFKNIPLTYYFQGYNCSWVSDNIFVEMVDNTTKEEIVAENASVSTYNPSTGIGDNLSPKDKVMTLVFEDLINDVNRRQLWWNNADSTLQAFSNYFNQDRELTVKLYYIDNSGEPVCQFLLSMKDDEFQSTQYINDINISAYELS